MHIFLWRGESGGHGRSMQSSAYPVLIGCFGKAIVGSIVTDTAFLAIAHYRSNAILAGHWERPRPCLRGPAFWLQRLANPSPLGGFAELSQTPRLKGAKSPFSSRAFRTRSSARMSFNNLAIV